MPAKTAVTKAAREGSPSIKPASSSKTAAGRKSVVGKSVAKAVAKRPTGKAPSMVVEKTKTTRAPVAEAKRAAAKTMTRSRVATEPKPAAKLVGTTRSSHGSARAQSAGATEIKVTGSAKEKAPARLMANKTSAAPTKGAPSSPKATPQVANASAVAPVAENTPAASSTAATRKAAAAFVAARQRMAPATVSTSKSNESAKGGVEVADSKVSKTVAGQDADKMTAAPGRVDRPVAVAEAAKPAIAPRPVAAAPQPAKPAKPAAPKGQGFKTGEFIVYPSHGVGQIIAIEEQEVAGYKLELFVISFIKDKMILKVPLPKIASVGMRKLAEAPIVKRALDTLTGRARVKRTMWSRRAQEYEAKINSGDLVAIAEVVRDLYRSEAQPEQSYSERQLYEAALDRMARELSVVQKLTDSEALKLIDDQLQKGPRRGKVEESDAEESEETDEPQSGIGEAA